MPDPTSEEPHPGSASGASLDVAGVPRYGRVLLKLSGEALMGRETFGIDAAVVERISAELQEIHQLGVELAIVIGGGNICRGSQLPKMERAPADYMGMLATVMNGLALQDALERLGVYTRVVSAIEMREVAEPFIRRRAMRHLEKGRVVIFVAGTGSPFFTTDSAAALRAMEIKADVLLKATKVDGIYSADPAKEKGAVKYDEISYSSVLEKKLKVMDTTAISFCMDYRMPIVVFDLTRPGNIKRVVLGERVGSEVRD